MAGVGTKITEYKVESKEGKIKSKICRKHIVLDMDGTLLYNYTSRPGLYEFLFFLFTDPRVESVSIWTASQNWYSEIAPIIIQPVLEAISKKIDRTVEFLLVWEGNRCIKKYTSTSCYSSSGEYYIIKPIKKLIRRKRLGMTRENVIFIDDTSSTFKRNYGNAIRIEEFRSNSGGRTDPFGGASGDSRVKKKDKVLTEEDKMESLFDRSYTLIKSDSLKEDKELYRVMELLDKDWLNRCDVRTRYL